jgi:16S rRNA (adenine1518-N6/adenine1519-N6)-dimethyltransferase
VGEDGSREREDGSREREDGSREREDGSREREDGTQTRGAIRRLLDKHDHRPTKTYGQNFLADPNIVRKLIDTAELTPESQVLEIGAGTGTMTAVIAEQAGTVIAYEVDESLSPILSETVGNLENVELRFEDASNLDLGSVLGEGEWTLIANLPYNVGTGIVLDTLQNEPRVSRIVVMVQREVADRLLADAGSKIYGLPSVTTGLHAKGRLAFSVPRQVFEPIPRVDSAVILLDRIDAPPLSARAVEIATAGFGQRRKMLRRSLASVLSDPERVLMEADIDPTARPEQLAPTDFVRIAEAEERTL